MARIRLNAAQVALLRLCVIFQMSFPFSVTANLFKVIDTPVKEHYFSRLDFFSAPYVLSRRHGGFSTATYFFCPGKTQWRLSCYIVLFRPLPTREIHSRGVFINAMTELSTSLSLPHRSACNAHTAEFDDWLSDLVRRGLRIGTRTREDPSVCCVFAFTPFFFLY